MISRKRLCFITTVPFVVKVFLPEIINRLHECHDVTVVFNNDGSLAIDELSEGIELVHIPIERKVSVWRDIKALYMLGLFLCRRRFDAVHTLAPKAGLLGMVAAKIAGVRIRIHTFQGEVWVTKTGLWRYILMCADKVTAWSASHLIVVSKSERDFLISSGIVSPAKSTVLGYGSICGVDTERFKPDATQRTMVRKQYGVPDNAVVFLFLGRLNRDKGVLDLVRAFIRLNENHREVRLFMVGPDEDGLVPEINRLTIPCPDAVHYCGYAPEPERFIAAADVLCLPSYREGFGLVIIEAAAMGLPAVASRIYGVTDAVVDGETGLLHRPGDVNDILAKMTMMLTDPVRRLEMGELARRQAISRFEKQKVVGATVDYYSIVLAMR